MYIFFVYFVVVFKLKINLLLHKHASMSSSASSSSSSWSSSHCAVSHGMLVAQMSNAHFWYKIRTERCRFESEIFVVRATSSYKRQLEQAASKPQEPPSPNAHTKIFHSFLLLFGSSLAGCSGWASCVGWLCSLITVSDIETQT